MPDPLPASLQQRLSYLIGRLYFRALALERDALAELGIDVKQQAALALLADEGPMTQQVLGQRLGIDRTTVVRVVDGVERLGLVKRGRHPADRRSHLLALTPPGREAEQRGRELVRTAEQSVLADLDEAEHHTFLRLLTRAGSQQPNPPTRSA
jgi:DNA-binding MarR family transcriptional regulator